MQLIIVRKIAFSTRYEVVRKYGYHESVIAQRDTKTEAEDVAQEYKTYETTQAG